MTERGLFSMVQCEHWNGYALSCKKGVEHDQVVDSEDRIPCVVIRGITGAVACDMRRLPSSPGAAGEPGVMTQMLKAALAGSCTRCNAPINGEMEFNGAVLALPCRHVLRSAR